MESNKQIKSLQLVIRIKGIIMLLLGVVHSAFAYSEYQNIRIEMPQKLGIQYILWFFATGVFLLFIGFIDTFARKGLPDKMPWAWKILWISAIFTASMGIVGVVGLSFEPSPPYLIFVTGIVAMYFLIVNKNQFNLK